MKKLFLFAAMAATVFASCGKNEITQKNTAEKGTPVSFGVYAGKASTKTEAITTDNLSSFGVYASYTTDVWTTSDKMNFMFDQSVTGSHAGGFTYSPVKYWPNEITDRLSFWAYAPYKSASNGIVEESLNTDAGYPTISYTFPADANQVDLLWATPVMNQINNSAYSAGTAVPTDGNATISNKVTLHFNHALALLDVQARYLVDAINTGGTTGAAVESATTVTINSITLSGSFPASGVLNLNDGTWSVLGTATATDFNRTFVPAKTVTNANASIIAANEQMMVIPNASSTAITVTVNYDVTTADTNLAGNKVTVNNVLSSSGNLTIQGGKKYNIILVLGLTSVKFDVEVGDWGVGSDVEVNLPKND